MRTACSRLLRCGVVLMAVLVALLPSSAGAQVATPINKLPATIKKPGSYVLKRNLVFSGTEGNAITIAADDVVLDLGGRVLANTGGLGTGATGVYVDGRVNVTIRNGTLRGFFRGVRVDNSAAARETVLRDLVLDRCTAFGAYLGGAGHTVRNCTVRSLGGSTNNVSDLYGILIEGSDAVVVDTEVANILVAQGQMARGISIGNGSNALVERNYVHNPSNAPGFVGILLTTFGASFVSDNRVSNFGIGIGMSNDPPKYRNNLTLGCTTPYTGGTNAGNNQ